jgi:hypothetical protein
VEWKGHSRQSFAKWNLSVSDKVWIILESHEDELFALGQKSLERVLVDKTKAYS